MTRRSRRDLLRLLGGSALALGALPGTVAAQSSRSPRKIRWAAGWLLWRDFKGRTLTLADALKDLKDAGADGIEFTPRPGELDAAGLTLDTVARMLKDAGLVVSAHYFSGPFCDAAKKAEILSQAQEHLDRLKTFGAVNLVIGPPRAPEGMSRADAIARMAPVLNDLGRHARSQGLAIGIHPHLNTVVETPDEADALLAQCDPAFVGLALDTGHCYLAGGDVVGAVRKHGARLNYFHFKDAVRPFARPDFFPNLRDLGKGEVDFPGVMRALRDLGYAGWVNVEQDFTATTPGESCRASMAYVRSTLAPIYI
jgi:sugar phosphate isomerase/epimerase